MEGATALEAFISNVVFAFITYIYTTFIIASGLESK